MACRGWPPLAGRLQAVRSVFFRRNDTTMENGCRRVEETQSIENTRHMLDVARKRYSALLIGPPPIADVEQNERIRRLSRLMGEVAAGEGVAFLSIFESLIENSVWMAEVAADDGAHPRAAGYAELAARVDRWPEWWFK
ncbi:MAG: GDSL-type esterase/lipase family protein [Candidatus Binatia bacterium]